MKLLKLKRQKHDEPEFDELSEMLFGLNAFLDEEMNFNDSDWNENKQFVYAVYFQEVFIGLISVLNVAWKHKRAEIGYWLDSDYTGKGLMSEAVSLIEKELFANDFNRIVIHTDVLNTKSAKIPQRLGYVHEGILRQEVYSEPNNRFRDSNVFSKLKSDIESDSLENK